MRYKKKIDKKQIEEFKTLTLDALGWSDSSINKEPIDRMGQALPWWTYPSIEYISQLLGSSVKVFEYGCGNSTLWLSKRVGEIISVEHDVTWANKMNAILKGVDNAKVNLVLQADGCPEDDHFAEKYFATSPRLNFGYDREKTIRRGLLDEDFVEYASSVMQESHKFDCIVIDGMARRLCCVYAVEMLNDNGIIIFDNANRSDYMEGYTYLRSKGFFNIPFWGNVPGAAFPSCTSLFVRDFNSISKLTYKPSYFSIPEY